METKPTRFVRLAEVKQRFGMSTSTIYALIQQGRFPKQIKIGANTAAWIEEELEAHARALIDQARGEAA